MFSPVTVCVFVFARSVSKIAQIAMEWMNFGEFFQRGGLGMAN